jgi:hypothetical protein
MELCVVEGLGQDPGMCCAEDGFGTMNFAEAEGVAPRPTIEDFPYLIKSGSSSESG